MVKLLYIAMLKKKNFDSITFMVNVGGKDLLLKKNITSLRKCYFTTTCVTYKFGRKCYFTPTSI